MSPKSKLCAVDKKDSSIKTSNAMDRGQVSAMPTSLKWRRVNSRVDALDMTNLDMSLKHSDKKGNMKELTTQFSRSKKWLTSQHAAKVASAQPRKIGELQLRKLQRLCDHRRSLRCSGVLGRAELQEA